MTVTVCSPLEELPDAPALARDEVHLVSFRLDGDYDDADYLPLLDDEEKRRAARFVVDGRRRQFVRAHAVTRLVLARYAGRAPGALAFSKEARGKPRLARLGTDLRFNLSHSADRGLLAVGRGRELGVDIERIRPIDAVDLSARLFLPAEHAALLDLEPQRRTAAFFDVWTRKESFVKAIGRGLSAPLDFGVGPVASRQPTAIVGTRAGRRTEWTLMPLACEPGYAAALTVEGYGCRIRTWAVNSVIDVERCAKPSAAHVRAELGARADDCNCGRHPVGDIRYARASS